MRTSRDVIGSVGSDQDIGRAHLRRLSLGVVVPSHNNSRQLRAVLLSLANQSVLPEQVVVVDDHSNTDEERRVRSISRAFGALYRRLPSPRDRLEALGRRSHARNLGTKCLDTDLVLYLDGDMLLSPKYIEEIEYYHRVLDRIYVRGQRYSIPAAHQAKGLDSCLEAIATQAMSAQRVSVGYVIPRSDFAGMRVYEAAYCDRWEWCASNNLSVKTAHVAQIGYWDENFLGWGEEDIDFSFRLHQRGLTPLLLESKDAAAYHLDHDIDHEMNRSTLWRNGRYLMGKFPELWEYRKDAYAQYGIDIEDLARVSSRLSLD